MHRRAFWPVFILMSAALGCSSSTGSVRDIACALQGVSPLVCNQGPSQPSDGPGGTPGVGGTETPAPSASATLPPTPTLKPRIVLEVVYSQAGNIWLWAETALPKQLTGSGQDSVPKISDDGVVVAFRRNGELWAVNADGTNERVLASAGALAALPHTDSGGPLEPRFFDFAPHSHDGYFNTMLIGNPFSVPQQDLAKANADNPAVQSLLNDDQGGDEFTFSPDGTKIALARSDKINVANADGSGLKTVFTFPFVMLYSEASYTPQVVWLPDASGFKTVIPAQDALGDPSALTRFMFVPADGSQAAQLAEFVAAPAFADRANISPDGAKVLYAKPQGANLELHVIDASTADQMVFWYAASNFGVLGWAPDSIHFVYWIDDSRRTWLGSMVAQGIPLSDVTFANKITWLDANRYLFMNETELRMRTLGQPSILIESGVDEGFDFALAH